jgi:WD40 repeat protein
VRWSKEHRSGTRQVGDVKTEPGESSKLHVHQINASVRTTPAVADVLFVHGLGDNSKACWSHGDSDDAWPAWIAADFPSVQIWLVDYPAAKYSIENASMSLRDRAHSFLHNLVDRGFGDRPIMFITHSLGGLVVKQSLRIRFESRHADERAVAGKTRAVAFIATPHIGSWVAEAAKVLGVASIAARDLSNDNRYLEKLKAWYCGRAPAEGILTRSFSETQKLHGVIVVSDQSANPEVVDGKHTPVDADHLTICKPASKDDPVYIGISAMLESVVPKTGKPRVAYVTVPPLPDKYVEREDMIADLRQALTTDRISENITMIAVHGMGGLGKTVLAQALCHDEIVQQAFSDGVIWISIGKEPQDDIVTRLREVGKAFGDDPTAYDTERGSKNQYMTIMRDKAALIVLDDVWKTQDVESFRAESPCSRLLFTTRDADIASGTGAYLVTPGFLSLNESRDMLARWSGLAADEMPPVANDLIRECGGLALAVSTIGAMLREKPRAYWQHVHDLLRKADLTKLRQQFPDYPYPDVFRALQVSVDALDPKMRLRYFALAVVLEDMPIHPLIQRVLWNAAEFDALETAEEFVRLALSLRTGNEGGIRIHNLLLDYMRAQYPDREALDAIHGAMRLSAHVIGRDPGQFASQLIGRLLPYDIPAVTDFTKAITKAAQRPWFRPRFPALQVPGTGLIRTLEGHTDQVTAVVVTSDGRRAISGSHDNTLKLWDLDSGRVLQTLEGHAGWVNAVAVTPDGRRAVSGSSDKSLKVWDLESGHLLKTLDGHTGSVLAVAVVIPDGQRVVSSSYDTFLKVWDLESGCPLQTLEGHTSAVATIAVTPDGRRALSGSWDDTLKVWDLASGDTLQTLKGHTGWVCAVAVTPDGRRAVSGSFDGTLKVWDLASGDTLQTLKGHTGWVCAVAVTPNGRNAVSGCYDRTLRVWDIASGQALQTLIGHAGTVYAVAVTPPDGQRAVSASADHMLKAWDLANGAPQFLPGHSGSVEGVAVTPDGRRAVSGASDGTLKVWDLESGQALQTLIGHAKSVTSVAVTPDGQHAISGSYDNTLKVWDLESGQLLKTLEGHTDPVMTVTVTPDGGRAVSGSWYGTLKVWDIESGHLLQSFQSYAGVVRALAVTPDGGRAVSGLSDATLKVWDLESRRALHTLNGHTGTVNAVAATPDGRRAVSGSSDNTLKIWDLDSGRTLLTLAGHTNSVTTVSVVRDGRRAISGSVDRTLKVWDLASTTAIATFSCDASITCCAVAQNGTIVAGDAGGQVHILTIE